METFEVAVEGISGEGNIGSVHVMFKGSEIHILKRNLLAAGYVDIGLEMTIWLNENGSLAPPPNPPISDIALALHDDIL